MVNFQNPMHVRGRPFEFCGGGAEEIGKKKHAPENFREKKARTRKFQEKKSTHQKISGKKKHAQGLL
jgi:hypothetical protein